MPKVFNLTIVLSTVLLSLKAETGFSLPKNSLADQNFDTQPPLCYIKTSDGRTLDLSDMCGFLSPEICKNPNVKPELAAKVKEFCKKNEKCALNSTCNQIPQPLQPPKNNGEPL